MENKNEKNVKVVRPAGSPQALGKITEMIKEIVSKAEPKDVCSHIMQDSNLETYGHAINKEEIAKSKVVEVAYKSKDGLIEMKYSKKTAGCLLHPNKNEKIDILLLPEDTIDALNFLIFFYEMSYRVATVQDMFLTATPIFKKLSSSLYANANGRSISVGDILAGKLTETMPYEIRKVLVSNNSLGNNTEIKALATNFKVDAEAKRMLNIFNKTALLITIEGLKAIRDKVEQSLKEDMGKELSISEMQPNVYAKESEAITLTHDSFNKEKKEKYGNGSVYNFF